VARGIRLATQFEYGIQNDVWYYEIEWLEEHRRVFSLPLE